MANAAGLKPVVERLPSSILGFGTEKDVLLNQITTLIARGTKPTFPEVKPLVQAFYKLPNNGAGGRLHIVLDDNNVDDDSVDFCLNEARMSHDILAENLAYLLLMMSKTQRLKLSQNKWDRT